MAFTIAETFVDVGFNNKNLVGGLSTIRSAAAATGSAIWTALGPVAALVAGAFAFKEVVGAAIEAEAADTKLAQALANSGAEVDSNVVKFNEFATALQRVTTKGDEEIKNLVSLGLNLGVPAEKADEFAQSAIGLGRALGIDAAEAMKQLSKEAQGVPSTLNRSIPALNGVEGTTARLAVISQMAAKGLNEEMAQAKTLGGTWERLKGTLGDTAELIGGLILPALQGMAEGFNTLLIWIQSTWRAIADFGVQSGESFSFIGDAFAYVGEIASTVLSYVGELIHNLIFMILNWDLSLQQLALQAEYAFKGMLGSIQYAFMQGWEYASWFWNNLGDIAQTTANFIGTVISNLGSNIVTLFKAAFEAVRTGSFQPFKDMIFKDLTEGFVSTVKELPKQLDFGSFMPDMSAEFGELDKQWTERAEKWEKSLDNAVEKPRDFNIKEGDISALPQALAREQEKTDKETEKSSSVGAGGGLVEAWKRLNEGIMKGEDKQRREALALAKRQLTATERVANAIEKQGMGVALAG